MIKICYLLGSFDSVMKTVPTPFLPAVGNKVQLIDYEEYNVEVVGVEIPCLLTETAVDANGQEYDVRVILHVKHSDQDSKGERIRIESELFDKLIAEGWTNW